MTYSAALTISPIAYGSIKCTFATLYDPRDGHVLFSLQKKSFTVVETQSGYVEIIPGKDLGMSTKRFHKPVYKKQTTSWEDILIFQTLQVVPIIKQSDYVPVLLSQDVIEYILEVSPKAAERIIELDGQVSIKACSADWTAAEPTSNKKKNEKIALLTAAAATAILGQ